MNRNVVINKMKSIIDNLEGICTSKLIAELLLAEVEHLGMLPPPITKVKKYPLSENREEVVTLNEWDGSNE